MGKWQILYLRTRHRSKLGCFFWFGPIHVTIRRNLGADLTSGVLVYSVIEVGDVGEVLLWANEDNLGAGKAF